MNQEEEYYKQIDPIIHQCALELSYRAGEEVRKLMLENGMTEQEVEKVIRQAFAWR
jgi:hypothetical protein